MLAGAFYFLFAVFSFLLVLSFLVFFHELGHYSVARFFNIAVEKFSIGFGRPIARRRRKSGEIWQVSRIPLGGYVKFAGDAGVASNPDVEQLDQMRTELAKTPDGPQVEDIFHFRPVWQRALVVAAGPIANFLLAAVLFTGLGLALGQQFYPSHIGKITADSPAAAAGFQYGDNILEMDGRDAKRFSDVQAYVSLRAGSPIEFIVDRDGVRKTLIVTPEREVIRDQIGGQSTVGRVGMQLRDGTLPITKELGVLEASASGVAQVGQTIAMTGTYLGRLFQGKEDGKQLGSVVKIGTVVGKVASDTAQADVPFGVKARAWAIRMISLAAMISIALGIANLMPLPVLDGGHLLYYSYEAVAGRPLSQKTQELGFRLGFAVLLGLFVILTINDIGYVGSFFSNLDAS
jgi:regulator of sigma E protease